MATFTYRARNNSGAEIRGTLIADTTLAAARMLDERSLVPVELSELAAHKTSFFTGRARRLSLSKVGLLYEQLADLLRAGVPILRALNVLSKQSSSPALTRVLREVHDHVAGGDALADAMAKHPEGFPELHCSMVRAGEKGGFLEDVLTRLSEFVARQDQLRNKFIGALIYPAVLAMGGLGAVLVILLYVVPKIRKFLDKQELGWTTQLVFGVNDLLKNHALEVVGVLVVLLVAVTAYLQTAGGKLFKARLQLTFPGLGNIYTRVSLCRFCRIFGTMLANGIPILQALRISKDSTGNPLLTATIEEAAENVSGGESLVGPLSKSKFFPPAIVDMIAVAEESNTLEKVLIEVANTQEERTAHQIDLLVRLIEPLMLMVMGAVVMFIAVSLLLPILKLASTGLK
ncbi:Type II secretion system protein F [Phycisphaerae bacterium RAS1]|nr:Type II secretion system protein F [Phycisphaerae bacterium RAS1]